MFALWFPTSTDIILESFIIILPRPHFVHEQRVILPSIENSSPRRLLLNCFRTISREKLSWEKEENWGRKTIEWFSYWDFAFIADVSLNNKKGITQHTFERKNYIVEMTWDFPPKLFFRYFYEVFFSGSQVWYMSSHKCQKLIAWTRFDNKTTVSCQRLSLSKSNI